MSCTPKPNKRQIGSMYEVKAEEYLEKKGYIILENNFRNRTGEIDIIAKDNEYIVFVEVKFRTNTKYGLPREAVNRVKQKNIINVAKFYIERKKLDSFFRFDVVEVFNNDIKHIINAFWEV
ncbi:MAG: YraN family protein [Epulopiscium sp. Nuni2H_MBin003]|nr:MAG: YraN family protein [Epulopiscium sp. Nuni2H_MBin003]